MIRVCGFEWGSTSELDVSSTGTIQTGHARTGSYGGLTYNGSNFTFVYPATSEVYLQIAFYVTAWGGDTNPPIALMGLSHTEIVITISFAANRVMVYTGNCYQGGGTLKITGTNSISLDTWYVLEVHAKIDSVSGVLETRVDGVADGSYSGNTKPGSATTLDSVRFWSEGGLSFPTVYWDDVVINDTTGTRNNSWVDGAAVLLLRPNVAGSTSSWDVTPSGTTHYLTVNEVPPTSTGYVSSTKLGNSELFGIQDLPVGVGQVLFLSVDAWIQRVPGSTTSNFYELLNCPQGLQTSATPRTPGTSFLLYRDGYEVNPKTGTGWTLVDVNALEVGAKVA